MEKPGLELWLPQSCSCCHASAVIYLKEVSNQDLINPGLIQLKLPDYEKKKKTFHFVHFQFSVRKLTPNQQLLLHTNVMAMCINEFLF